MFYIYAEYLTPNECSVAVRHASELHTAVCEQQAQSVRVHLGRYTVVMVENQVIKQLSVFLRVTSPCVAMT
jgi:hypothetical protein